MGIRYPEGRTGRPREIGGRQVRKEEEGGREGGPEGLRQAHQARAGHAPEDAGARGLVQADREGAGQVALDGVLGGGVAQVRDRAEGEAGSSASIPRLDETRTESAHSCAARAS